MLEQFAPDKDSVTGIIRVRDDDTNGPMRRKYIKDNNLRKEVAELGIGNNIEEQFYYHHKMVFEKYSNKSNHINLNNFIKYYLMNLNMIINILMKKRQQYQSYY